ncbi:uncharacterized protein EI97DRAFT_249514 [Westerdykella ornata]|uniref:Uncharacterized protein n=1 Tax=Westerdykella ornata TaxID=318751 RepID=A0A6A6JPT8_WESOR|nr:uncharacterized protein EI97DRAFT_249514 [Westerdykella ornata]KAF2278275.1 hypothetical protein EI97DRAFT_249514 [Westerdykella ornata]
MTYRRRSMRASSFVMYGVVHQPLLATAIIHKQLKRPCPTGDDPQCEDPDLAFMIRGRSSTLYRVSSRGARAHVAHDFQVFHLRQLKLSR